MEPKYLAANVLICGAGSTSITYAATGTGKDTSAVTVWTQFRPSLKGLDGLNDSKEWEWWASRYAVLSENQHSMHSSYTKDVVLKKAEVDIVLAQASGTRINWAKANKTQILKMVAKVYEECKWAYGRHINKKGNDKSWLKAIKHRKPNIQDSSINDESYKYWRDVFIMCSKTGSSSSIPSTWLKSDTITLYDSTINT